MKAKTIRLTTGQALVKFLQGQYSQLDERRQRLIPGIFGIFGHGNVTGLGQALQEYGHDLPYYQAHNEQSMVHTASGFAKARRRLQTLACTSSIGPGATNMITGAATATINRLPVLLLPGDYYGTRHQGPVLQQLEHPISADVSVNDCFRPVARFFDRITRPEQLLTALPGAMRVLTEPAETGAVVVALPQDIQSHAWDYPTHFFEERTWRIARRPPEAATLKEALALLAKAQRPMIIAGGGVLYSWADAALKEFGIRYGIPVSETTAGKGAFPNDHPLSLGGHGTNGTGLAARVAAQADLVICIGTRLADFNTGSHSLFQDPAVQFISINVTGADAIKLGAIPILADARATLEALVEQAASIKLPARDAYHQQIDGFRAEWNAKMKVEALDPIPGEIFNQAQLISTLNDEAKPGDVIISAAGHAPGDLLKLWNTSGERYCHIEFGNSCMGYELPAGLGVRLAGAEGEVIIFIGDGTFLMCPTELVTALKEDLKITVVIPENHGFQSIRNLQMVRAGRSFGNEFRKRDHARNRLEGAYVELDLARTAEGMGARAWRVSDEAGLRIALQEARSESRSCVIVVEIEKYRFLPWSGIWWDFEVAEVTGDEVTRKLREQYEADRAKLQRFYY